MCVLLCSCFLYRTHNRDQKLHIQIASSTWYYWGTGCQILTAVFSKNIGAECARVFRHPWLAASCAYRCTAWRPALLRLLRAHSRRKQPTIRPPAPPTGPLAAPSPCSAYLATTVPHLLTSLTARLLTNVTNISHRAHPNQSTPSNFSITRTQRDKSRKFRLQRPLNMQLTDGHVCLIFSNVDTVCWLAAMAFDSKIIILHHIAQCITPTRHDGMPIIVYIFC